jgi:hypothetical protein
VIIVVFHSNLQFTRSFTLLVGAELLLTVSVLAATIQLVLVLSVIQNFSITTVTVTVGTLYNPLT